MLKNYLKIAFRILRHNQIYFFVNVIGLSISMAACFLICLFVVDELSYDHFHQNDIYRIDWYSNRPQTRTPHPMTMAMMKDFPEVKSAVSITPIWGDGLIRQTFLVQTGEKKFEEKEVLAVDTTFFDVFNFPVLRGDAAKTLKDPQAIIITQAIAEKYFGTTRVIGKILTFNNRRSFRIGAVLKDVPQNAHFHFDFLISYLFYKKLVPESDFFEWGDFGHFNYVALHPNTSSQKLEQKIPKWLLKYVDWSEEDFKELETGINSFRLTNIKAIHLYSNILWELEPNGNIAYVYIFSTAAFLILLISFVNFINLTSVFTLEKSKEIGVRKLVGAKVKHLFYQFLMEVCLIVSVSYLLAIMIIELILPFFNHFTAKRLDIFYFGVIYSSIGSLSFLTLVIVLATIFRVLLVKSLNPIDTFKKKLKTSKSATILRESLVAFQFVIAIGLMICTFTVYSQLDYLKNQNLGFDKNQVLIVPIKNDKMRQSTETFKEELQKNPSFISVSATSNIPFGQFNQQEIQWQSSENTETVSIIDVDYDFFKTLNISLLKGRNFDKSFVKDSQQYAYILNETAAKLFAWENPINQNLTVLEDEGNEKGTIIGIVKDFNFQSLHHKITPIIFRVRPQETNYFLLKIREQDMTRNLQYLEKTWKQYDEQNIFEVSFLDQSMYQKYQAEVQMGNVFGVFAGISILVACLGLFALASFLMIKRTKEIGIRKVLGATVTQIILLLSKDYLRLVLIAFVVAIPLAWYVMRVWLQNFAYQIEVEWWIFMLSGLFAILIAFLAISYQSLKASNANPVEALRNE